MRKPRLPFLNCERTRHGRMVWYVRVGRGPRIRIRADYGTPDFDEEYHAAIAGKPLTTYRKATAGTFEWASKLYRESSAWLSLSDATRRQRENIIRLVVKAAGDQPLTAFTRAKIVEGRERRATKPAAARHFVETLRGFFQWAVEREIAKFDPTEGVKVPRRKSDGYVVWTEDDLAAYEARWPLGTRERLAYEIFKETGLRRGDAAVVGRQHVKDGIIRLRTEKTGEMVAIPISAELRAAIDAGPVGELSFIAGDDGKQMRKESVGNWFAKACKEAGVPGRAHGIRKAAATRAANAGFSEAQLEARFGWRGGRMASLYTKTMDRERLSLDAQRKLETRTASPAPSAEGAGLRSKISGVSNG